jgi:hypothetical protein
VPLQHLDEFPRKFGGCCSKTFSLLSKIFIAFDA